MKSIKRTMSGWTARGTWTAILLLAISGNAYPCGDPCGDPDETVTAYIEGRSDVTGTIVIEMLDHTGAVVSTVNVTAPTGGGPVDGIVEIPVPWGNLAAGVRFSGPGSAGNNFGLRLNPGLLIWRTTEGTASQGDSVGRPGDWLGKGSQWWIKRKYPFPNVTGQLGRFEVDLPRLVTPHYTDYSVQEDAEVFWILRFGDGGALELSGGLNSGSTLHDSGSVRFWPANATSTQWLGWGAGGGDQYVFANSGAGSPLYVVEVIPATDAYTLSIYDGYLLTNLGPYADLEGTAELLESYTVTKLEQGSGAYYHYGLRIAKDGGFASEFFGLVDYSGFEGKAVHDTGVSSNQRKEIIDSDFVGSGEDTIRSVHRIVTDEPAIGTISDLTEEFQLIGGIERLLTRSETSGIGGAARLTVYTYYDLGGSASSGKLHKVETSYNGTPMDWRAYTYEVPSTGVYRVHEFGPWEDTPASVPGSLDPASFSGKLVTRDYHEATSTAPRLIKQETTKVHLTVTAVTGDTQYFYSTLSDGVSGVTFDRREERRYTSSTAYLRTYEVTWPRQPPSTYRHWALAPRYTQPPDNTKIRHTYSGGGTSNTVHSVWNEPLVSGKTQQTVTTTDPFGRTTESKTDLYISSTWYYGVSTTMYTYGKPGWLEQVTTDSKVVESISYDPSQRKVDRQDRNGIWVRRKHDRLGRVIEEKRDAGGGVAENTVAFSYVGLSTTRTHAGGTLTLQTSRTTDRLGRPTQSTDEQGLSTTYSYAVVTGGMATTETLSSNNITQVTSNYRDGRLRSLSGTGRIPVYYDYGVDSGSGQTFTAIAQGLAGSTRKTTTYYDWAARIAKTITPMVSNTETKAYSYHTNGTAGDGGRLKAIDSDDDTVFGRQVYDYNSNGELLLSGMEPEGGDGVPTASSTEEVTRTESNYVRESNGTFWLKTETWIYDVASSTHLRKLSASARQIGGDAYLGQSYTINYTDNNGAYGVVTARKDFVLSRSSATAKTEVTQWDLTGFVPGTLTGSTQISLTAVNNSTHGYLQSATTFTVSEATTYDYDDLGRLTHEKNARTSANNALTAYWGTEGTAGRYRGKVKSVTDGLGYTTTYGYYTTESGHPRGALKYITNVASKSTRYQYNIRGQLTHVWGDTEYPLKYVYEGTYGDRTEMHTYKGGSGWTIATLPSGFAASGDKTTWTYNTASGLVTYKADHLLRTVSFSYHAGTALVSRRTWARAVYTDYTYDLGGRLAMESHSDGTPPAGYTYDRTGRLVTLKDDAGEHAFTESFASGNRTATETVSAATGGWTSSNVLAGTSVVEISDKWGRRTDLDSTRNTSALADLSYTYEPLTSRLKEVTAVFPSIGSHSGEYTYHGKADLITSVLHQKAGTTKLTQTRTWNGTVDRLDIIGNTVSGSTVSSHNYGYDNLHRRTTATTEDATYWDYGYNDRSETTSGTKKLSGGTGITGWSFSYAYDNIGNRTSYSGGSESITYSSYNALNQPGSIGGGATYNVKGRTESTGSPAVTVDTVSQTVTTQTAGTKKYFNASVTAGSTPDYQLVSISDGSQSSDYNKFVPPSSYSPSFDNDGNLIEDDRWTYTWDANNRLKKMETRTAAVYAGAPAWTLEFKYDAFGRRIEKKKTWAAYSYVEYTDIYVYDGWNLIARVRNGSLHQSYVWGLDLSGGMQGAGGVGGLLMTYTTSGGSVHFPAYDGNGNIMSLVNASTSVVEADYAYDPFGGLQRIRGTNLVEWDNPFRFSTKYTDDESGHLYYGYRYLDPRHGRWLGRDPIGEEGGLNLYGFVGNDGVNGWDSLGLQRWEWFSIVSKSYIDGVGTLGSLPARMPHLPLQHVPRVTTTLLRSVPNPALQLLARPITSLGPLTTLASVAGSFLNANQRLALLAAGVGILPAFNQNPTDDRKDGEYRLYAKVFMQVCCVEGKPIRRRDGWDKDGGNELPGIDGTIWLRYHFNDNHDNFQVVWTGWGRPNLVVEPGMQWVGFRNDRIHGLSIWHEGTATITCDSTDKPVYTLDSFIGSRYPSRAVWFNGTEMDRIRQGDFADLWTEHPTRAGFVR